VCFGALVACGGRDPDPVPEYRVGDEKMTCPEIKLEMAHIDVQVNKLIPESKKTGKNVVLGVTGWFLIVPWFFMDFSDAEKVEIKSYQERYLALEKLWVRAGCNDDTTTGSADGATSEGNDIEGANERLRVLNELKEQGLISDEEYTSKRQEIIRDL